MKSPTLLDQNGNPVRRAVLTQEVAAASIGSVRSPISGYAGDGLNPQKLAAILREADAGDALRYLELAETIEERDAHYLGVLGTRRRAVAGFSSLATCFSVCRISTRPARSRI